MIEVDVGGGFGVRGEFYSRGFPGALSPRAGSSGRSSGIEDRREHLMSSNHARE